MSYRILIFIFCLGFTTACVSPKIVEEIKQQRQETFLENQKIKSENLTFSEENIGLKDKLFRYIISVNSILRFK